MKILFRTSRLHLNQDLDGNISGGLRVAVLHCAVGLLVADGVEKLGTYKTMAWKGEISERRVLWNWFSHL